jgi:hypothetical protein
LFADEVAARLGIEFHIEGPDQVPDSGDGGTGSVTTA